MIKDIYQHDGITYKRTNKATALKLIQHGRMFFLVGSKVNQYNFHSGCSFATSPRSFGEDFQTLEEINEIKKTLESDMYTYLGKYAVFYVAD